jgi:hypothetical protein
MERIITYEKSAHQSLKGNSGRGIRRKAMGIAPEAVNIRVRGTMAGPEGHFGWDAGRPGR